MLKEDPNKSDMTLVIQVNETFESADDLNLDTKSEVSRKNMLEKFTEVDIKNGHRMHGYAIIQLNNPDNTLKYGTFNLNLFRPPINLRRRL